MRYLCRAHEPEILGSERDWMEQREVVVNGRSIIARKAIDPVRADEIDLSSHSRSNAKIYSFVINHGKATHHLCGNCKMGIDNIPVVDESLRV
jgi:choline dehydrogenase-like flavoprotein